MMVKKRDKKQGMGSLLIFGIREVGQVSLVRIVDKCLYSNLKLLYSNWELSW